MLRDIFLLTVIVISALMVGLLATLNPPIIERVNSQLEKGKHYLNIGMYKRALRAYSRALSLDATSAEARLGYKKARVNHFTLFEPYDFSLLKSRIQELASITENDPHVTLFDGDVAFFLGDINDADTLFSKAQSLSPIYIQAYFASGVVAQRLGDTSIAKAIFQRTIDLAPNRLCYQVTLAETLLQELDADGALAIYKKIVREKPHHYPGYFPVIAVSMALGNYLEAEHFLDVLSKRLESLKISLPNKKNRTWIINYTYNRTLKDHIDKFLYTSFLRTLLSVLSGNSHHSDLTDGSEAPALTDQTAAILSDDVRMILAIDPGKSREIRRFGDLIQHPTIDWIHGNLHPGEFFCGSLFTN